MAVIVVAGVLVFFVKFNLPEPKAGLIINFDNGQVRQFEGRVDPGMTVVQAIFSSSLGGRFEFRYYLDQNGDVNLSSIGRFANVGLKSWRFYINGQSVATKDLDRIQVKSRDLIEARYE